MLQLTPGAGAMYCGNCLRDNALVAALRKLGHEAFMAPLYLPLTLDETDHSAGMPIFFGGINVYLQQKSALFRGTPEWMRQWLASPALLRWAGGRVAGTRPEVLGELTESMLRGEEGNQARELDELVGWLKLQPRLDVICLSNALLMGLARRLQKDTGTAVACMLQGEDWFLDSLPEPYRTRCWSALAERAAEIDVLIAPTRYFASLMSERLHLPPGRIQIVPNGIELDGYATAAGPRSTEPVLGFFARMCREKGVDTLVEAYIRVRKRGRIRGLRLKLGGSAGPAEQPLLESLKRRLAAEDLLADAEFHPNLDRARKVEFLQSLSVFSVPALYGEAFGLYLIEALAAGVPVVQPRTAAFPELVESTGGGVLCSPGDPESLADMVEHVLEDPERARALGEAGRRAVRANYSAEAMACGMHAVLARKEARDKTVP